MNKCTQKILIVSIVLIIVVFFYFRNNLKIPSYMYNKSNYAPTNKGFSGIKIKDLIQSKSFYSNNRDKTITYLKKVYPSSIESLNALGDLELASFYNSLSYYYVSDNNPLPYPPQGWFFNNCIYQKSNQPLIFSDSDDSKECLNLNNFISSNMENNGPGLAFVDGRSIQRNIYFPNGLSVTNKEGIDYWNYVSGQKITWNYPKGWQDGLSDYSYIEVTHIDPIPSDGIQSPGWWWNALTGSGIFLNVGKTLAAKNKLDAVYRLLSLSPKEFLISVYQTTDINNILFNLVANCKNSKNYCNTKYTACDNICKVDKQGVLAKSGLPLENFYQELLRFQFNNNISNEEIIVKGLLAARENEDYRLNRISQSLILDETLFFLGLNLGYDTIQLIFDPNLNGFYVFEILDLRLPKKYIEDSIQRNYTFFDENNNYVPEFVDEYITNFVKNKIISIRDPLDIYNESKVFSCNISSILSNSWSNFYCDENLSKEFKYK